MPLIRSPDELQDLERPRLQPAVGRGLVLAEGRRRRWPASATRREPRQPMPGPRHQAHDVVVGLEPQLVRRHDPAWRPRGAARSARPCRTARTRRRSGRAARSCSSSDRLGGVASVVAACGASVARARCSALLTDATLVSSSSATSSARQRSTSRRMRTARWRGGRCWSAATNASRIDSRATATSAGSPAVGTTRASGIGSIQSDSASGGRQRLVGGRGGDQVHRPSPALAGAEHVEADVGRDAVEPGAEGGATLEAVERPPRAEHRLLDGVLGLEGGAEHPVAVGGELDAMAVEAGDQLGRGSFGRCKRTALGSRIAHRLMLPARRGHAQRQDGQVQRGEPFVVERTHITVTSRPMSNASPRSSRPIDSSTATTSGRADSLLPAEGHGRRAENTPSAQEPRYGATARTRSRADASVRPSSGERMGDSGSVRARPSSSATRLEKVTSR